MINIHEIAAALHAKKTGTGWIAKCPAHEDKTPSLSLRERDGRILLHCHAGCPQDEVIAAFRARGLWPERSCNKRSDSAADPDYAVDMLRARYWSRTATMLAEWFLETREVSDPQRKVVTDTLHAFRIGEAAMLAEYRSFRQADPRLAEAMVRAGRLSDARLQRHLAQWIAGGMHGEFTS